MKMRPIQFVWSGEAMVPVPRFMPICNKQFAVHEKYPMHVLEPRSMKSHSHYFACIHTAWENLPEALITRFPTAEHLRKWALVDAGYAAETNYAMDTPADARKMAAAIRRADEYAVIKVSGNVVKVFTARSQSIPAMKNEEFKDSKEKVLDIIEALNPGLSLAAISKEATKTAPREKSPQS